MMDDLIIEIKNGLPWGHPYVANNFIEHYPEVDVGNLPPDKWCKFIKYEGESLPLKTYYDQTFEYYLEDGICRERPVYIGWDDARIQAYREESLVVIQNNINKLKQDALDIIALYPESSLPTWEKYLVALNGMVITNVDSVVYPRVPLTPARLKQLIENDPNYDPTPSPEVAEKLRNGQIP